MNDDRHELRQRLRALFLDELDEHVVVLNRGLVALEQRSAGDHCTAAVNELFRSAHGLKGAAQAAAVEKVVTVCHALEGALAGLRDAPARLAGFALEPLFEAVDTLASAGRQLRETGEISDLPVADVIHRLSGHDTGGDGDGRRAAPATTAPRPPTADAEAEPRPSPPDPGAIPPPVLSDRPAHGGIRVPSGRLDALLNRAGEVLLACEALHAAAGATPQAAAADRVLASAQKALSDAVREAGMVPFGEACAGLERVVRDVARAVGKQAWLAVRGGEVELDRPIVDGLREPLVHLVRNAVDHGIEMPQARLAEGKPPAGTVTVAAAVQGSRVAVTVSDDGGGIDTNAVRAAAMRRGVDEPAPGDDELELVFTPGLSTAPSLTEVSGRGVGLDAVRVSVEALGGSVAIQSSAGRGTEVTLVVPITRSVSRVVLVRCGSEIVALPTDAVVRLVRPRAEDVQTVGERNVVLLDDRLVPVAWLCDALGTDDGRAEPDASTSGVVVDTPAGQAVLVVDEVLAEQEALIKPPPPRLAGSAGVLGATILSTGRAVVVLNPATAVRTALGRSRPHPSLGEAPLRPQRVLLVDDTLTTRTLERSILETAGYQVTTAVDGMQALDLLLGDTEPPVDAVVTDVNMPRMDGLELCAALRSSGRFQRLPVILVTSLASEEDRRRGVEAGADAYIAKSEFDQSMLLDTLARLL